MAIITKNWFKMSILAVLVVGMIIMSGCTSQTTTTPVTTAPTTAPAITTAGAPIQTSIPASIETTRIATITTTQTPANSGVSVTINSAVKKITMGGSSPMAGNIFLVLDVTIQNNDKNNDFTYTDASFGILDKTNKGSWKTAITYKIPGGMDSPLTSGTIPIKSTKTGQIVFGVPDNSNTYKFSVSDSKGSVLTTIDNINAP